MLARHRCSESRRAKPAQEIPQFAAPKSGVLEKVASERVARVKGGLVAAADPRAALDDVVPRVKRRNAEVVVDRVHAETVEFVDRGLGPLPHIACAVVAG
jgi:hypothetical protein